MPESSLIQATLVSMGLQLLFAVVSLAVGAIAIKVLDRFIFKRLDLEEEIARGNLAAAVAFGALWLTLAIILAKAT